MTDNEKVQADNVQADAVDAGPSHADNVQSTSTDNDRGPADSLQGIALKSRTKAEVYLATDNKQRLHPVKGSVAIQRRLY